MEGVMQKPIISILCPVMNVEKYIGEMIESVLAQTFPDWELIVMDGQSRDGTVRVVQRYADADPRIRVYSEPDESPWHAVDKMFNLARGEFITIVCGQDGFLDRDWLRRAAETFKIEPDVSLVWGLARTMTEDGKILSETHVSYSQFIETEGSGVGAKNVIGKFFSVIYELLFASWARKKMLLMKIFSKSAFLRVNLLTRRGFEGKIPQKEEWFRYWLDTALVFPDQSMCIKKEVFLACVPRYRLGSKTLGHMTDFFFNFNAQGYLAYYLPMYATFGRMHGGQSGQRGAEEMHREFQAYLAKVRELNRRVLKGHEPVTFKNRQGEILKTMTY